MRRRAALIGVLVLAVLATQPGWSVAGTDAERLSQIKAMYDQYRQEFPGINEVSADSLQAWLATGDVVLVDVRKRGEREVSILPGAISAEDLNDMDLGAGQRVVVYCTVGYRSGKYVRRLQEKGVTAFNLKGGILAWLHGGGLVVHAGKPTRRVHVFGKKWSLLPEAYEAVW